MHGSVDRLIERLSDPRLPGADFMETFLLTYRAFTSGKEVMEGLITAYWKVMGGRPSPPKVDSPDRKKLAGEWKVCSNFMFNLWSRLLLTDSHVATVRFVRYFSLLHVNWSL